MNDQCQRHRHLPPGHVSRRPVRALGLAGGLFASLAFVSSLAVAADPPPPAAADSCSGPKDCLQKGALANQQKDFARAAKFLGPACDIEPKACNIVGELYRKGEGVAKDGQKAADFHRRACESKIIVSCAIEAQLRYRGEDGAQVDKARARVAYEKSCGPDFYDSCANVGVMFANGEGGPVDKARARVFYEKACVGGEQTGCVNQAALLLSGEGGPAEPDKGRALLETACTNKNAIACYNLGVVYAKGQDVPQDFDRAQPLIDKACSLGNQEGCKFAAQLREDVAKQKAAAAQAAAKAKPGAAKKAK